MANVTFRTIHWIDVQPFGQLIIPMVAEFGEGMV